MTTFGIVNAKGVLVMATAKSPKFYDTAKEANTKLAAMKANSALKVQAYTLHKVVLV
jgi:hypothetical protein